MKSFFEQTILTSTNSKSIGEQELIQSLWSGYGEILKIQLENGQKPSVIVKYIDLPDSVVHPRGWNTQKSHERKVKSYDVEMNFYSKYSQLCDDSCRVAENFASASESNSHIIVLEDLDAAGFPIRKSHLNPQGVKACLSWLANFHATFLEKEPEGLWDIGTYWHLDTRPDELQEMHEGPLKTHAKKFDQKLNSCKYKTFVHGDAKVANFCFSKSGTSVSAVDFQYVGGGCGMKDIAYFLGSCLDEHQCQQGEEEFLNYYFQELKAAVQKRQLKIDFHELETEWRGLYSWAWTDFYRFLLGWMPTHYKIHSYTKQLSDQVLSELS
ncbi:MAG: ecdysteroid 22-kinase family protein [Lentisphaeraceae bacterium]|nr:ecdysteroid 22-kinase family protein [Lentisphaeraceae bacterium]